MAAAVFALKTDWFNRYREEIDISKQRNRWWEHKIKYTQKVGNSSIKRVKRKKKQTQFAGVRVKQRCDIVDKQVKS